MGQIYTVAITALVTASLSIWGTTVIVAHSQKNATFAVYSPVDVTQLTKDAKDLPVQSFDAF